MLQFLLACPSPPLSSPPSLSSSCFIMDFFCCFSLLLVLLPFHMCLLPTFSCVFLSCPFFSTPISSFGPCTCCSTGLLDELQASIAADSFHEVSLVWIKDSTATNIIKNAGIWSSVLNGKTYGSEQSFGDFLFGFLCQKAYVDFTIKPIIPGIKNHKVQVKIAH